MRTNENENPTEMSEALITKALEGARNRISRAEQERAELERVIAAAREEERLLVRLLALRQGKGTVEEPADALQSNYQAHPAKLQPPIEGGTDAKHPAVQAVIHELASAARPLHISELMRLLRERQVSIPGAGTQANLITHLRRDARLVRPSRGMYGLAAWGLENMPAKAHRKRRRRRVRFTDSTARTEP
jgi:hypothetical protein